MDHKDLDGIELKIPKLATGTVLPHGAILLEQKAEKERRGERRETRRFWIQQGINIVFGSIAAFAALNSIFQWIVIKP